MTNERVSRCSESGLSTIEALVAIAILAIAIIPILQFQSQLATSYRRYDDLIARTDLQRNALGHLSAINPLEEPTGEVTLGLHQSLKWRSEPITEERRSTAYPVGDGDFMVALFRIEATIEDTSNKLSASLAIERLGWRKAASPSAPPAMPP